MMNEEKKKRNLNMFLRTTKNRDDIFFSLQIIEIFIEGPLC